MIGALLSLALLGAPAVAADEVTEVYGAIEVAPELAPPGAEEARARADVLAKGLRCPVCQALSVADSDSEAARSMYQRILELVEAGYSDAQIEDYFVDRYGEWIRLEPPAQGLNWLLFIGPGAALLIGAAWVRSTLRRPPGADAPAEDPYRDRVLVELAARSAGERPQSEGLQ